MFLDEVGKTRNLLTSRVGEETLPPPRTGRADFPHPARLDTVTQGIYGQLRDDPLQVHQAMLLQVLVVGLPFRRMKGSLAATL